METPSENRERWKTRRRFAKIALTAAIIETLILVIGGMTGVVTAEILTSLGVVIMSSYTFFGGIIAFYIGTAVMDKS